MGNASKQQSSLTDTSRMHHNNVGNYVKMDFTTVSRSSEFLSKIKRTSTIVATFAAFSLGAPNILNSKADAAPFISYYYVIPTLKRDELKVKGDDVTIGGREFKLFKKNLHYFPKGTEKRPFAVQQLGVLNKKYGSSSEGLTGINVTLIGVAQTIWRMDAANYADYLQNNATNYKGLGYYCFQVGVSLPFRRTWYNLGEGVLYLETPKPVTYKEFLTDANTLYKLTKNTAEFYGDSNKEFVKQFIYQTDYTFAGINPRAPLESYFSYVKGRTTKYFLAGAYTKVNLPGLKITKFVEYKNNDIRGLFRVYNGVLLKITKNYIPGYGDGTRSFPFKITKDNLKWRGPGYYYFQNINGAGKNLKLMTASKVDSKSYLKDIYNRVYAEIRHKNFIYSALRIKGKLFFYAQYSIGMNRTPIRVYQNGGLEHPYLFLKFFKKGRYFMMGSFITPIINSKKEFNEIHKLLQNSKRAKIISNWDNELNFVTIFPNVITEYKEYHRAFLTRMPAMALEQQKNMLEEQIRFVPVRSRKSTSEGSELISEDPKTNSTIKNIGFYKQDPVFYKKINGVEFDKTKDVKYAYERTGTKNNPFLSNEGPRGIGYYQISGTNYMTPMPVDGTQLDKWFKALHRKEGSDFNLSKSLYFDGGKPIEKRINGYEVYEYKKPYTENFGTVTEPYFFNKNRASDFVVGTPSYFLLRYKGKSYVNVNQIKSVEELEEFYNKITGKKLAVDFKTRKNEYYLK
ncbi:MAG: hypothetical protein ACP5M9_00350 [Candidatus Micrarchaeia archaeon]